MLESKVKILTKIDFIFSLFRRNLRGKFCLCQKGYSLRKIKKGYRIFEREKMVWKISCHKLFNYYKYKQIYFL